MLAGLARSAKKSGTVNQLLRRAHDYRTVLDKVEHRRGVNDEPLRDGRCRILVCRQELPQGRDIVPKVGDHVALDFQKLLDALLIRPMMLGHIGQSKLTGSVKRPNGPARKLVLAKRLRCKSWVSMPGDEINQIVQQHFLQSLSLMVQIESTVQIT
jgi:hypothetical protein